MEILIGLVLAGVIVAIPIALIIYIIKTNTLAKKVAEVERRVETVARDVHQEIARWREVNRPTPAIESPLAPAAPVETPQPEVPPIPSPPPPPIVTPPLAPAMVSSPEQLPAAIIPPIEPPVAPRPEPSVWPPTAPPLRPSRTRAEWEALIGGKLLNRIGALALIIGVGFFLKYAFDNDWFPEWLRVLIGLATGAGLLVGGARAHKKELRIFAAGLIGAGISILYLSVYASFNFYHLVSQPVAFVMMSVVTVLAFSQAFKYDSRAVSLLGWAGGFLTPFLLSTGEVNEVGLFTYIALLDIGLLTVVVKKDRWAILEPLTLLATWLIYEVWNESDYTPDKLGVTLLFVTLFWGLFYALDMFRAMRAITTSPNIRHAVAALNALFYVASVYDLVAPPYPRWTGAVTLAIGAVYLTTALAIKRRQPDLVAVLARYVLTAASLVVLATAFQFSDFVTVACWSAEALLLMWYGIRWQRRHVRRIALGFFAVTLLFLIATDGALKYAPIEDFTLIFNLRALAFTALALALGVSTVLSNRLEEKSRPLMQTILRYGWCAVLFALVTVETRDYFEKAMRFADQSFNTSEITRLANLQQLTLSGVWLLYSIVLMMVGIWRRTATLRLMAIMLFGVAIAKIFIYDLSFLETLYRIFSFIGLGVILLVVSYLYQRYKAVILGEAVNIE